MKSEEEKEEEEEEGVVSFLAVLAPHLNRKLNLESENGMLLFSFYFLVLLFFQSLYLFSLVRGGKENTKHKNIISLAPPRGKREMDRGEESNLFSLCKSEQIYTC